MVTVSLWIIVISGISLAHSETRYACLRARMTYGYGGYFGSMFSDHSSEEAEAAAAESSMMSGQMSCSDKPNSLILVTKVIHGHGGMYEACASPDEQCDHVTYAQSTIAKTCDRKLRCMPSISPKFLPHCHVSSNFIHVEYECVDPWSVFEICHDSKTLYKGSSVFLMSPQHGSPLSDSCECILKEKNSGQIRMDYAHSNLDQIACPGNYLLVESKLPGNKTGVNAKDNICGRKTVRNKMYRGSLRLTYGTRTRYHDDGFISKLSIKSAPGATVSVECGPVMLPNSGPPPRYGPTPGYGPPPYRDRYRPPPPPYYDYPPRRDRHYNGQNNSTSGSYQDRGRWHGPRMSSPYWDPYDEFYRPYRGPQRPQNNNSSSNSSSNHQPPPYAYGPEPSVWDFYPPRRLHRHLDLFGPRPRRRWPQNNQPRGPVMDTNTNKGPRRRGDPPLDPFDKPKNSTGPVPTTKPQLFEAARKGKPKKLPSTVQFIGRTARREGFIRRKDPSIKNSTKTRNPWRPSPTPKRPVNNVTDGENDHNSDLGKQIAYIVGGVGAILCAGGLIVIMLLCSRRRKRLARKHFGQGRRFTRAEEHPVYGIDVQERPVYTIPVPGLSKDVDGCHTNSAFHSSTEDIKGHNLHYIDDSDPYNTVIDASMPQQHAEQASEGQRAENKGNDYSSGKYSRPLKSTSGEVQKHMSDAETVYDNNI